MAQTKNRGKTAAGLRPSKTNGAKKAEPPHKAAKYRGRGAAAVFFLLLGIFSLISYFSSNGVFIGLFCNLLKGLLGWGYYTVPLLLFLCAAILSFHRGRPVRFRVVCTLLISVTIGALLHLLISKTPYRISFSMFKELWVSGILLDSGGALGGALSEAFTYLFSKIGAAVVLVCTTVFFLLASFNRTIVDIIDAYRRFVAESREPDMITEPEAYGDQADTISALSTRSRMIDIPLDAPKSRTITEPLKVKKHNPFFNTHPNVDTPDALVGSGAAEDGEKKPKQRAADQGSRDDIPLNISFMEKRPEKNTDKPSADKKPESLPQEVNKAGSPKTEPDAGKSSYAYPTLDLLSANTTGRVDASAEVRLNVERLEAAFKSFGVNVKISSFTRGPTVTRYEAELEAGIKLARLTGLADDIALSLGASGVRIAAMPNKISTVGIEVPNKLVSKVLLRDIIDSPEFKKAPSKLTFAIGKNIGGEAIVGDISKLPHMLVAGTTGSGKSVCLNSLILSLLYKSTPEEVRFIMIDPKMVEFRVYNGIPHLLVPVVTDVKKAAGALQWAVVEMMKRYRMFSEANARDLESYNKFIRKSEEGQTLPQIVVVIDELADLMMTAAKEVEESVCRVAQMGRAAGVHLVIATQSPRADVITGLMKANIPSRIALKVSSALESRIILDAGGNADKLVGNGDMLYAPIGSNKPVRIQGTWVSDSEREKVVEFVKKNGDTQYNEEVIEQIDKAAAEKSDSKKDAQEENAADYDELLPQAVDIIFESGQASVSMLQRRLKLGYSRAARIVDQMEQLKIVGPFEGSKPRQLLITRQQWREMQFIHGTAPVDTGMPDRDDFVPEEDVPF